MKRTRKYSVRQVLDALIAEGFSLTSPALEELIEAAIEVQIAEMPCRQNIKDLESRDIKVRNAALALAGTRRDPFKVWDAAWKRLNAARDAYVKRTS